MPVTRRCREKFQAALYRLAVGEGDVRQRLRGAYRYLRMLSEEEVPVDLRTEWRSIQDALTRRGPDIAVDGTVYKNSIDNTLAHMRNVTGRRIAERIYALARAID